MHFLRHRHYSGGRHHLTGRFGLGDIYLEVSQARIHSEAAVRRLLYVFAPLIALSSITLPEFPWPHFKIKSPGRTEAVFQSTGHHQKAKKTAALKGGECRQKCFWGKAYQPLSRSFRRLSTQRMSIFCTHDIKSPPTNHTGRFKFPSLDITPECCQEKW